MTYTAQQAATAIGFGYRRLNRLALRFGIGKPVKCNGRIVGREFSKADLARLVLTASEHPRGRPRKHGEKR